MHLVQRTAFLLAALAVATTTATRVGTTELAAHQIAAQLFLFLAIGVGRGYLMARVSMSPEMSSSFLSGTASIGVATSATVGPMRSARGRRAARSKS